MFPGASVAITGGTINNATNMNIIQSKRGIDILMEFVAADALHDSDELYDAPKCHPYTRVAVLDDIIKWVIECKADLKVEDDFILWLFGAAGAGKSAIAKKIAELAADKGLLIGSFFFSRTSSMRNNKTRLIPTLAYQLGVSVPETRNHIEEAIERDPVILHKNIEAQIDTLLIKPFQFALTEIIPFQKLLIIDGLDECSDSKAQVAILDAISRSFTKHKLPIIWLVASRPETDITSSFNGKEPLKSIHRRLALDDTYHPDDDIRRFFSDKFEEIRCSHRLRATISLPWPTDESLDTLVKKSSGQFIFAATVVRFVESNRHQPSARLDIILGISPPGTINPFDELDQLYRHILSSVDDIKLTLRVLSLCISSSELVSCLNYNRVSEPFLSLKKGDTDLALIGLSSIVSYDESSGQVKILHASFADFLSDKRRSNEFYIDMVNARTDFACRTLQYVKGPDGMRAGDINVFAAGFISAGWILNHQLRNEILNFDLDAFITAAIETPYSHRTDAVNWTFVVWIFIISLTAFEDADEQLLINRYRNSFESRIQKYQLNWRLQLLFTLAVIKEYLPVESMDVRGLLYLYLDILLEIDHDNIRLVDQDALDLRYYSAFYSTFPNELSDITSLYVDGDRYASAALHCMHFLSNPPKLTQTGSNISPGQDITYYDWKATYNMALFLLCELLTRANPLPELIQFMSDHDINRAVQKDLSITGIWRLDTYILAFLDRAGVCVNWRIISAIRRARTLSAAGPSEWSESSEETYSDIMAFILAKK